MLQREFSDSQADVALPPWGVCVVERHYSPHFRGSPVRRNDLEFVYVVAGKGSIMLDRGRLAFSTGNVAYIPPGACRQLQVDPCHPPVLRIIHLSVNLLKDLDMQGGIWDRPMLIAHAAFSTEFAQSGRYLLYEQTLCRPGFSAVLKSTALNLISLFFRRATSSGQGREAPPSPRCDTAHARVKEYMRELEQNFGEPQTVKSTAASFGISRRRFTQCFRELSGVTWLNYIHRLRVAHAKLLLAETNRTVLSIGFECGFECHSTFYRVFYKNEGVSPQEWRELNGRTHGVSNFSHHSGSGVASPERGRPFARQRAFNATGQSAAA